jgi:DNA-directed RNA polymerase specialized sigma24 family protein
MLRDRDVALWIHRLRAGEREVVQKLWQGYSRRLVGLARLHLRKLPRRAADDEDVALFAFTSFILGAEKSIFSQLETGDDVWQLLVLITRRKAINLIASEGRGKRDYRRVRTEEGDGNGSLLDEVPGQERDPALAAESDEECQRLLACLPDEELRQIALCKMEGYTNEEIAGRFDLGLATVGRRLAAIREAWAGEMAA